MFPSGRSYRIAGRYLLIIIKQDLWMKLVIVLIIIALVPIQTFQDCNFTQFDFFSRFSLGQMDELNRTFEGVNKKMGVLPDIEAKSNSTFFTYRISATKANFKYLDGKQTAEVIGNDIVFIKGGKAETFLNFNWSKDQQQGTGTAYCLTDSITFAKLLYLEQAFMVYKLADFQNVSYYQLPCNITRVDPALEAADITFLEQIINDNQSNNIKTLLIGELLKYYGQELNSSLYDQRQPINNHSEYTWVDPTSQRQNFTINYTLLPTGAHLSANGLSLNFVTEITDDDDWKCGATVPTQPKSPNIYGGIQEFLSLSILENTVRFAARKGVLDTLLNRKNWQSSVFQFFAGDLYEVIPSLAKKYYASDVIDGTCSTLPSEVRSTIVSNDTFSLMLPYSCELKINATKISSFDVSLTVYVQAQPQADYLNYKVTKCQKFAHFKDEGQFQIHDIELANFFLSKSLERLSEGEVFGSGWKIYARDYPKVLFEDGYMFIYDASGRV